MKKVVPAANPAAYVAALNQHLGDPSNAAGTR